MTDNIAVLERYTREVVGEAAPITLYLLIKPDTYLDSTFRAWDMDEQCFIHVDGWLFTFEDVKPEEPAMGWMR